MFKRLLPEKECYCGNTIREGKFFCKTCGRGRGFNQATQFKKWELVLGGIFGLITLCLLFGLAANALRTIILSPRPTIVAIATAQNTPTHIVTITPLIPTTDPIPTSTVTVRPVQVTQTPRIIEPQGRIVYSCNDDDGFAQICIINADGSNERRLTSFSQAASTYPSLASDGNYVIFTSNKTGDHAIYRLSLLNNQLDQLTEQGGDKGFPQQSPNGLWIAYADVKNKSTNIYVMNSDGSNLREIYSNGNRPVWSSDSQKLAFICLDEKFQRQICIMDKNGNNVKRVSNISNLQHEWVSWSPDGSELAFAIGNKEDKNRKICVINIDGSGLKVLYDKYDSIEPSYSPDGNWISFLNYLDRNVSGRGEIFIMRRDGSDVRRLTNNDRNDWLPVWGN